MHAERHQVDIVTASDGSATGFTPALTGRIVSITYTKHGTTPFANGVDFAITAENTGEAIWTGTDVNATTTVAPRQATHSTAGAASLYAAGGTAVTDHIVVAKDRVKIVIAQGGDTKNGTFHVVVA